MSLKEDEMGESCSTYTKDEKCIQHLVRIPGGETPLERPWGNDIKVELDVRMWTTFMCFRLASSMNTVMNLRVT
jgi:hypothetical protein